MNVTKHVDFFDPSKVNKSIHIIGVGAIGSHLAIMLTKLGIEKFVLYDFDTVESKNVTNQAYVHKDIGQTKLDAISKKMLDINPQVKIRARPKGWQSGTPLSGYVFLAVDSIELRKQIVEENINNLNIIAVFDTRMGLTEGQTYASTQDKLPNLIKTMDFKDDEVKQEVSACNSTLSILPLVWSITSSTVSNFINFVLKEELNNVIIQDAFKFIYTTF
jgi:molybdopterin/thiamine biosynthesis adenylyltransferase